jgi:hypothetical protein
MMRDILKIPGALRLDSNKLRRIACEIGDPNFRLSRLDDQRAIREILQARHEYLFQDFDLVSAALVLAQEYDTDLDPVMDVVRAEDGTTSLHESYWRRIVSRMTGQPWAFILNYADNHAAERHEDVHGVSYGFDDAVTTWKGIVAAGPGSAVVFYNTSNAPSHPMTFSGIARVREIEERPRSSDGKRVWRAHLEDFQELSPVSGNAIAIPRRNVQHGIQAISWTSYKEIVSLGNVNLPVDSPVLPLNRESTDRPPNDIDKLLIATKGPELVFPAFHEDAIVEQPPSEYVGSLDLENSVRTIESTRNSRRLDKLTETRAIEIVVSYMASQGWTLRHDRQRDGVGYDLEFQQEERVLCVEVKGIRGSELTFNMTAKEWHRCVHLPNFLLIAVTRVLDKRDFDIHLLWPHMLCGFQRHATQFRLKMNQSN